MEKRLLSVLNTWFDELNVTVEDAGRERAVAYVELHCKGRCETNADCARNCRCCDRLLGRLRDGDADARYVSEEMQISPDADCDRTVVCLGDEGCYCRCECHDPPSAL